MESSRTITELKTAFIRSQIRTLSAALEPSEDWRQYGAIPEEGDIGDKAVEEVLVKLNTIFKQHNRTVYSSQAIRHVARQIESLYWNAVSPDNALAPGQEDMPRAAIDIGTDLTNSSTIARLPDQWIDNDDSITEEQKTRYTTLLARLTHLSSLHTTHQKRLAQYKQLQTLLTPFRDPQRDVQPNLVTREGELGAELDRMRILVATVAGRVAEGSTNASASRHEAQQERGEDVEIDAPDSERRLEAVLDLT